VGASPIEKVAEFVIDNLSALGTRAVMSGARAVRSGRRAVMKSIGLEKAWQKNAGDIAELYGGLDTNVQGIIKGYFSPLVPATLPVSIQQLRRAGHVKVRLSNVARNEKDYPQGTLLWYPQGDDEPEEAVCGVLLGRKFLRTPPLNGTGEPEISELSIQVRLPQWTLGRLLTAYVSPDGVGQISDTAASSQEFVYAKKGEPKELGEREFLQLDPNARILVCSAERKAPHEDEGTEVMQTVARSAVLTGVSLESNGRLRLELESGGRVAHGWITCDEIERPDWVGEHPGFDATWYRSTYSFNPNSNKVWYVLDPSFKTYGSQHSARIWSTTTSTASDREVAENPVFDFEPLHVEESNLVLLPGLNPQTGFASLQELQALQWGDEVVVNAQDKVSKEVAPHRVRVVQAPRNDNGMELILREDNWAQMSWRNADKGRPQLWISKLARTDTKAERPPEPIDYDHLERETPLLLTHKEDRRKFEVSFSGCSLTQGQIWVRAHPGSGLPTVTTEQVRGMEDVCRIDLEKFDVQVRRTQEPIDGSQDRDDHQEAQRKLA
jgi:hypothetical protein